MKQYIEAAHQLEARIHSDKPPKMAEIRKEMNVSYESSYGGEIISISLRNWGGTLEIRSDGESIRCLKLNGTRVWQVSLSENDRQALVALTLYVQKLATSKQAVLASV